MSSDPSLLVRWSIRLILAGLVVELISLFGLHHPWGFLMFSMASCVLIAGGVGLYLLSQLPREATAGKSSNQ